MNRWNGLCALLIPGIALAQDLEPVRRATVIVEVSGSAGQVRGTGILLSSDGLIATAAHVLKGALAVRVRFLGGELRDVVGVVGHDPKVDLSFLKVDGTGLPTAQLGDSDQLAVGQHLYAIGAPLGRDLAVADGLLSTRIVDDGIDLLQLSIPVSSGQSGGPVVTDDGKVVGMIVSRLRGPDIANIGLALPAKHLRRGLEALDRNSLRTVAEIGRSLRDSSGVLVPSASPASLAPEIVNERIAWDFRSLDGIEVYTVRNGDDGSTFASLVRYGVSVGTNGGTVIERLSETGMLQDGRQVAVERIRTVLHAGQPDNHFVEEFAFASSEDQSRRYETTLEVLGPTYRYRVRGGAFLTGQAPTRVLPPHFLDAAIAAVTDLPANQLRLVQLDPRAGRLLEATLEITGRAIRKVPMARPGERCGPSARTTNTPTVVLTGILTVGLVRQEVAILAEPPFVPLDGFVRCLRLARKQPSS